MSENLSTAKKATRERVRRRMAIQHAVEQFTNEIIRRMRELVDETDVVNSRMEKHQIGNLLSVALETPSVELVKNFIRYQIGRDVSRTSWRKNDFGEKLVQALDQLRDDAEVMARDRSIASHLGDKVQDQDIDELWIEMTRQYLGQLNRYFYYKKEAARW